MKTLIILVFVSIFTLSGCATYKGVKKDSSDAWKVTKKTSQKAWESTSEGVSNAYDSTKKVIHDITSDETTKAQ